ncbi:MAG: N-6 DNA methylase [Pseudomonadota bacterium]
MIDYEELKQLEDDLWEAADQLRANSKLTATEYSMPVLGLIFLRHATTRFYGLLQEVEAAIPARATGSVREGLIKLGFSGKAAIYLPENSRYDYLASLPQNATLGTNIRDAMVAIEDEVTDQHGNKLLSGALPKDYVGFEPDLLAELIKIFNSPVLANAKGDVFGRIYEYFLNQFAMSGAQEGGEFFTPPSLVRMIVNVIEPDHGTVLDPACGSAGMFVQTGHFIEDALHKNTIDVDITFYGQEKADLNSKLARMNLAVHGLEGQIKIGNTFYEDQHDLLGKCDFVMANPPFNVDGVQLNKIKGHVGVGNRLPFGLPGTAAKSKKKDDGEAISNANSLWLQYFYSYLNDKGRAGFVMASSASDAGNKDKEIRQKLVETGHVDVMISIGNKFFYTRSLPCTLWFFDKSKPQNLLDSVLMLDARNVYTVVSAKSHVFTDEQLANLTSITWLYRGEQDKFIGLLKSYQHTASDWLDLLPSRLLSDGEVTAKLAAALAKLSNATQDEATLKTVRSKLADEQTLDDAVLADFRDQVEEAQSLSTTWELSIQSLLELAIQVRSQIDITTDLVSVKSLQAQLEALQPNIRATLHTIEVRHKAWLKLLDMAEKQCRARLWSAFDAETCRDAKKALQARDVKKREALTVRDLSHEVLKRTSYFIQQSHWLLSRFPDAVYLDISGLCKQVLRADIAANDYSLTPGRYVGVSLSGQDDDGDEAFVTRMQEIQSELNELNFKSMQLAERINSNFEELLG